MKITQTQVNFITKSLECIYETEIEKFIDTVSEPDYYSKWMVDENFSLNFEDNFIKRACSDCREWETDCESTCKNYIEGSALTCYVLFKNIVVSVNCIILIKSEYESVIIESLKDIKKSINSKLVGKDFVLCKCGYDEDFVFRDGFCKNCWIYAENRDEDCAICLENEKERWVKMKGCGHSFHYRCCKKIKNELGTPHKKCPLCRTISRMVVPELIEL
jgi:regulator of replication initiation timing